MRDSPSYLKLHSSGELPERIEKLREILKQCHLCPRRCGIDRTRGEKGYCRAPYELMVSSAFPHFGEEPPLVGRYGSGTIFLTHCNLRCVFCQNYDISHLGHGEKIRPEELAKIMLYLQRQGCHNINFVTPTHYVPQIVEALPLAIEGGLRIPLVYNSGGYDSLEVIKLLEGIFDIYMPDIKFLNTAHSQRYCNAPDYPEVVKTIIKEMHRQVGDLLIDERGIARRGLLVRHLVMPNGVADTGEVLRFIAKEISVHTYINIMDQYRPLYKAYDFPEIARRITPTEYLEAINIARNLGLYRGFPLL
ncbi:MAG: radical SAM protein [Deltaproteobacteria bacterium]|nr:MAG: radical SAM protein [Deltaproteobacteria bacterium]